MELAIVFALLLIVVIVGVLLLQLGAPFTKTMSESSSVGSQDFIPSQMYLDNGGSGGIAINEGTKKLCLMKSAEAPPRYLFFTELLASGVLKNGVFLDQTTRTNPTDIIEVIRELEGSLKATLSTEAHDPSQRNRTQKIDLCLVINDKEDPIQLINFLDMDAKEGGVIYDKALNNVKHWHHLLSELINQADNQALSITYDAKLLPGNESQTNLPSASGADELTKLSTLLEKQLITQEEFNTQKERLLAVQ